MKSLAELKNAAHDAESRGEWMRAARLWQRMIDDSASDPSHVFDAGRTRDRLVRCLEKAGGER